jgi:adenosylcobinamide kinase/adenosylcobinamide-phosphate guanylyltransferase
MVVADHILITGPSRGGKSEWAEQRLQSQAVGLEICYLATGPRLPDDIAWQQRLELHRQRRPSHWGLVEASSADSITEILLNSGPLSEHSILLDSLGGLVSSALELDDLSWRDREARFLEALAFRQQSVVIVAEEVGWGVVPPTAIGGRFRDRNGSLTRQCELLCHESWLVTAGRALPLHQLAQRVTPMN